MELGANFEGAQVGSELEWELGNNEIYDKDGDGIEDNIKRTSSELDKFYKPRVFKYAEEMHNTHTDELPGW